MSNSSVVELAQPVSAQSLASVIRMLPPLPDVAQQILDRFGDEFISASQVAAIVECDPAISARLFGLANSAYFGLPEPVTDMRDVVSRVLGPDTVRTLAFALAADRTFDLARCAGFDARRFWHCALSTAACARRIAKVVEHLESSEREFAYLAGMCHNLGLMVVACAFPEEADEVLAHHASNPELDVSELFAERFGFTLDEVTYELACHWDMPGAVVSAYKARAAQRQSGQKLATIIDASIATAHYFEGGGKNADGSDMEFPTMAADALKLAPEELKNVSVGSDRQRGATESAVQAMVGG